MPLNKILQFFKINNEKCNLCACAKNYNKTCTYGCSHLLKKDTNGQLDCPEFDYE